MVGGGHRAVGASRVGALLQRAGVLACFSVTLSDPTTAMDCATAVRTAGPGFAASVCQREYERTHDPGTGFLLADSLRTSGNLDAARAMAGGLLTTSQRANAFLVLGKIAITQGRLDQAETSLRTARTLHRAEGKPGSAARASQALSRVLTEHERFAEALSAVDECIVDSRAASDLETELYCRMTASRVLMRVGYFELAQQELDRAGPAAKTTREQAWLSFERGNLAQELSRAPLRTSHNEQAVVAFERAIALATHGELTGLVLLAEMNLAYSLGELLRFEQAEQHLETAKRLDVDAEYGDVRRTLEARFAFLRGNLGLAYQLNQQVYSKLDGDDERVEMATMQARIATRNNDPRDAEAWARRGIEDVERIRAKQTALELRPWVLSTRHEPYEVLFAVLVRAGRFEEALLAFDQWQGRSMLDAMARPSSDPPADLKLTAKGIERIGEWLPVVSTAPIAKRRADRSVLTVLAKLDLFALGVADGSVFGIDARAGKIEIRDLGPYARLEPLLNRFLANPTDVEAAAALGEILLPTELFRTAQTLHVLLDGPLASLPISALRRDRKLLISVRPIVRVLRLPEVECEPPSSPKRATVLADAAGDLPAARREADEVAALLADPRREIGATATRRALFDTDRDAVLHVAVHTELGAGGGTLRLADKIVSALEISASKLGPSLVMLSGCGSANANDAELGGSLATAFLASGSKRVVATLRAVSDDGSRELATAFYRDGGSTDPVRALARIQTRFAETSNTDWPSFVVFGTDVCNVRRMK